MARSDNRTGAVPAPEGMGRGGAIGESAPCDLQQDRGALCALAADGAARREPVPDRDALGDRLAGRRAGVRSGALLPRGPRAS